LSVEPITFAPFTATRLPEDLSIKNIHRCSERTIIAPGDDNDQNQVAVSTMMSELTPG